MSECLVIAVDRMTQQLRTETDVMSYLVACQASDDMMVRSTMVTTTGVVMPPAEEVDEVVSRIVNEMLDDPEQKCYVEEFWSTAGKNSWLAARQFTIAKRSDAARIFHIGVRLDSVTMPSGENKNYWTFLWVPKEAVPTG